MHEIMNNMKYAKPFAEAAEKALYIPIGLHIEVVFQYTKWGKPNIAWPQVATSSMICSGIFTENNRDFN